MPLQGLPAPHGNAPSVSGLTQPGSFAVMQGSATVRTYRPEDDGWLKSYCEACGSQLFTTHRGTRR
jgi:hypothetical protein